MKQIEADTFLAELSSKARLRRRPESVTFELTYGCNLRCVHCFNPTHRALPQELGTSEVLRLVDQLAAFGVLTITFTGGELGTRPDLGEIFRYTQRLGLLIRLLTNATRVTPEFVALLEAVHVEQVCVSIYGATASTYEQMTAVPGSYAAFHHGLTMLAQANLPVVVRMPVTTINHHDVQACRILAENFGQKFQYCSDITPMVTGNVAPLEYRLSPARKSDIDQDMLSNWGAAPIEDTCHPTDEFIECDCGHTRFAITPYGEMNLCTAFPIPRYDLRNGTVSEGWELLKRTVDEARPNNRYDCASCAVRSYCRQGRNDAWLETGDMSVCLPHYKQWAELEHRTHALLHPQRPG
ncbi:MAG: radical SAM protein [Nitrospira sp.]|nr:radical SAM protein [Nitrospira sp.]